MSIDRVILKFKRLERKKWQFEDETPKCVELAVLDYYESQGWQGYFTEKADYFALLSFISGWGDWSNKRPRSLDGIYDLLERNGYEKTLRNIKNTELKGLEKNLHIAAKHTKDKYHLSHLEGNLHRIDDCIRELISFYCCVGSEGLIEKISFALPKERIRNLKKIQEFDRELFYLKSNSDLCPPEGAIWIVRGKEVEDRTEKIIRFIERFNDNALIKKAEAVTLMAKQELKRKEEINSITMLDLVMWRDEKIAYVEVKAPRDKLFQQQINTLNKYEEEGVAAWVVDVVEA